VQKIKKNVQNLQKIEYLHIIKIFLLKVRDSNNSLITEIYDTIAKAENIIPADIINSKHTSKEKEK